MRMKTPKAAVSLFSLSLLLSGCGVRGLAIAPE